MTIDRSLIAWSGWSSAATATGFGVMQIWLIKMIGHRVAVSGRLFDNWTSGAVVQLAAVTAPNQFIGS